jgi:phenylalanyl-tRNA synthetase beta chain
LRRIYFPREGERLPRELNCLAGLATGFDAEPNWTSPQRVVDFYDLKGLIEDLLEVLQIRGAEFRSIDTIPYLHPRKTAEVVFGNEVLGVFGEAHPEVLGHYEIEGEAYLFELDFEKMVEMAKEEKRFRPLPKFPAICRDLSLVVDDALEAKRVVEAIRSFDQPFVDEINLFDHYRGSPIPSGKKGVSYRIRYQAADRTLTDEEVNQYHEKVISRLKEIFHAELR